MVRIKAYNFVQILFVTDVMEVAILQEAPAAATYITTIVGVALGDVASRNQPFNNFTYLYPFANRMMNKLSCNYTLILSQILSQLVKELLASNSYNMSWCTITMILLIMR